MNITPNASKLSLEIWEVVAWHCRKEQTTAGEIISALALAQFTVAKTCSQTDRCLTRAGARS